MSEVFNPIYSDAYDLLYRDKDYAGECDLIERIFRKWGDGSIRSVLDLGCGTGNHAQIMAQRGYQVAGVDRSPNMISHAQRKASELPDCNKVVYRQGDIRHVNLQQQFDAVLIMFAVLGYQLENDSVLSVLKAARRHLRVGGLLIFDVWYGPAVLHLRPSQRVNVIPVSDGKILRLASGNLDPRRHVCTVQLQLWHIKNRELIAEVKEDHQMRYFFPLELDLFIEQAGFTLVRLGAFPDFDYEPDEDTWNVMGVARAI